MIYAGEEAEHHGHPRYLQLIRRLREAGAAARPTCGASGAITAIVSPTATGCSACAEGCRC
jgi:hypothetical protein